MATAPQLSFQSLCDGIIAKALAFKESSLELGPMIQKFDATAQENGKLEPLFEKLTQKAEAVSAQLLLEVDENDSELTVCEEKYLTAVEPLKKAWAFANEQHTKKREEIDKIFDDRLKVLSTTLDDDLELLTELKNQCIQQLSKASPINTPTYQHPITYITIKYKAEYGNSLSICGTGPQMSWDPQKALPLHCVGDDTWIYETNANFQEFKFKIVLNNQFWEIGDDHTVRRDNPQQITPSFPS